MNGRSILLAAAAGLVASLSVPGPASAQPPFCPPGHAMKGWCEPGVRYYHPGDRGGEHGFRDRLRLEDELRLRIGQRLDPDRYRILDRGLYRDRYGRRLDDRYYYAEADGQRLLIEAATGAIIDLLLR